MTLLITLNFIGLGYFIYRVHMNSTNLVKPMKQGKQKSFDEKLQRAHFLIGKK